MNNIKLYVVIVLFKKKLEESIAFKSLNHLKANIKIIIWNNSPEIQFEKTNIEYHEEKNMTLPIIYNSMAKKYLKSSNDFLMISDDDTNYTNYNFEELFDILKLNQNQSGIFIPQLYANGKLVSPGKRFLFKGKYIKSINDGLIKSKNILGMNSGLIISYECFNKMPLLFDERLKFYGTDTDFFIRYENYFELIYVLPFKIEHDLSENNNNDVSRAIFRFKDDSFAINHTFKQSSFFIKILLKLFLFYKAIKLNIKYKSIEFTKAIFI